MYLSSARIRTIAWLPAFLILIITVGCAPTLEKFRSPYLRGKFERAEKMGNKIKDPQDRAFALSLIDRIDLLLSEAEAGHQAYDNNQDTEALTHYANAMDLSEEIESDWCPDTVDLVVASCRLNYAELLHNELNDLMGQRLYRGVQATRPNFDRYIIPSIENYDEFLSLYGEAEDNIREIESIIGEGDFKYGLGKYETAFEKYHIALELAPEYEEEINSKIAYCEQKIRQQAEESLRIGELEMEKNNPDEAIKQFQLAKEITNRYPQLGLDIELIDRYLTNAQALQEEVRKKEARAQAIRADKKRNGEWLGPFVIDKSRRGQEISAKGQGELSPAKSAKWQGRAIIPDDDIVFYEVEAPHNFTVKLFNHPDTNEDKKNMIEISFIQKDMTFWRTGDDYGRSWKSGKKRGSYYVHLKHSETGSVDYKVECVIYDSIDR